MTAIVGLVENGVVWVGGDSAGVRSDDFSLVVRKDEKVFVNGPAIFGFTSSYRMGSLLRYSLSIPGQMEGQADEAFMNTSFIDAVRSCFKYGGYASLVEEKESGGTFIVGYKGRIYQIASDYQVEIPIDDFTACGCGAQICLGSMCSTQGQEPEKRIQTALAAAERFSAGVRKPFIIKSL
ncbi:MAG: hypothetical protein WC523_04235 [Patescibacteria group bacterium]